jgi:hypothetical protein
MTDFMETILGSKLRKTLMLSESMAWYEAFDNELKRIVLDYIQKDQLTDQGIDEDSDIIGLYSDFTESINPEKIAGTPYTLDDTGDFYKSMYIVVLQDSIVIEADPIKGEDNLFYKYGEGIVGLTEENLERLREEIKKRYIKFVKKSLEID